MKSFLLHSSFHLFELTHIYPLLLKFRIRYPRQQSVMFDGRIGSMSLLSRGGNVAPTHRHACILGPHAALRGSMHASAPHQAADPEAPGFLPRTRRQTGRLAYLLAFASCGHQWFTRLLYIAKSSVNS